MKYQCGIIRDLLPLYHDNVCSAESREAVDEHLTECNECAEFYEKLLDDRTELVVPEREQQKAASFKAVSRRIKRGTKIVIISAAALLMIVCLCFFAIIAMNGEKRAIEYDGGNITVSMKPEGLVATVRGTRYSGAHIKTVLLEENGEQRLLKILRLEETEWDAFANGDNNTYDFTIAFADMEADEVDAVYYYSGALNDDRFKGMEEFPHEELAKALGEMTLLWEK